MPTSSTSIVIEGSDSIQASTKRVRDLIDGARIRHWSFADTKLGDGACVLFLNDRQIAHIAAHGAAIAALVGSALEVSLEAQAGRLVALLDGVPTYTSTYEDGWATHIDDDGVPYVDFTEAKIAGDPFGENGGVPGFPLPSDMVALINVSGVYGTDGRLVPINVVQEHEAALRGPRSRDLAAFISGNRLVPIMPLSAASTNTGDRWFDITALRVSYVGIQQFGTLDDVIMLPSVLCDALTADLCVLLANQSPNCPPVDKAAFAREAAAAFEKVGTLGNDMLGGAQGGRVVRRR